MSSSCESDPPCPPSSPGARCHWSDQLNLLCSVSVNISFKVVQKTIRISGHSHISAWHLECRAPKIPVGRGCIYYVNVRCGGKKNNKNSVIKWLKKHISKLQPLLCVCSLLAGHMSLVNVPINVCILVAGVFWSWRCRGFWSTYFCDVGALLGKKRDF